MRKIVLLAIIIILNLHSTISYGSIWSDIQNVLCNLPGANDRIETWYSGKSFNRGRPNELCPPWNKAAGRNDGTCIIQFNYPPTWTNYYSHSCAEHTPETSYFNPKIRVRNQSCNGLACWSMAKTLNWDGQCVVWPSPMGVPLIRICARIALPDDPVTSSPADPGYTYRTHLDEHGYETDDTFVAGVDGQVQYFDGPKLCAYSDPSLMDTIALLNPINLISTSIDALANNTQLPIDIMDWNPNRQILHHTSGVHPIAKVLIAFINAITGTTKTLGDMIASLLDSMNNSGANTGFNNFKSIFDFIGTIINFVGQSFTSVIKEFGQFNRIVNNYHFGCVNIPLGPFPPPFCPVISPFVPPPTTQNICFQGSDGNPLPSTIDNPCVVSKLANNFVNNSIRVTFDDFVPLCQNGENPMLTDKCVTLSNMDLFFSASNFHTLSGKLDIIKSCANASAGQPCVNTKIQAPRNCSRSAINGVAPQGPALNSCENSFRIVYATKTASTIVPNGYFIDSTTACAPGSTSQLCSPLPDCTVNSVQNCQKIWGVNIGGFTDISLAFPAIQDPANTSDLTGTFTMDDTASVSHNFNASIVRTASDTQDPSQICVNEGGNLVGCQLRQPITMPLLYECMSGIIPGLSCTSTYFAPAFIASLKAGSYSTSASIKAKSVADPSTPYNAANLAGFNFTSFVTDDTFVFKPFSGPKAPNPTSIYGTYKNNAAPIDANGNPTGAVYLYGLEYINDKYFEGGIYACLSAEWLEPCGQSSTNCILGKILNTSIVDCQNFLNLIPNYPNIKFCTKASTSSCTFVDQIDGINGTSGVTISQCSTGYCYSNNEDQDVCNISYKPTESLDLASNVTTISNNSYVSKFYVINNILYSIRQKTSKELGLCTLVPQLTCNAVTTLNANDNYALWPEGTIGQITTGTCPSGWIQNDVTVPLQRYCLVNASTMTAAFDSVNTAGRCRAPVNFVSQTNSGFTGGTLWVRSLFRLSGTDVFNANGVFSLTPVTYTTQVVYNIIDASQVISFYLSNTSNVNSVTVNGISIGLPYTKDLIPYLVTGINTIRIQLRSTAAGFFTVNGLKINYQVK